MVHAVLLTPEIEHVLRIGNFKAGERFQAVHAASYPAGKAVRLACTVAALRDKIRVVGFCGRDDLPFYDRFLGERGIESDLIPLEARTRLSVIVQDPHRFSPTRLQEPGPRVVPEQMVALRKRLLSGAQKGDWVAFCGPLPGGCGTRVYRDLIADCRSEGLHTALDSSGRALVEGVRGKPDVVKPNQQEFEQIFDEPVRGIQHTALKAKGLLDRGLGHVFVSLGEDGLLAARRESALRVWVKSSKPTPVDGCGDAMLGGLLVGFQRELSFEKTCRLGVACGAANTLSSVPGSIRKTDIEKFMGHIEHVQI